MLSRRALVEEENEKLAAETRKKLVPGVVLRGKVVGFKPFGAFVDIGGIEGMLHVSELGYSRVDKPEDILRLGQELDVAVLEIKPAGAGDKHDCISLSLKALAADPWRDSTANLHEGARVKGTITRLQPFGAFVEIAPGVEGLVHISELGAGKRINRPQGSGRGRPAGRGDRAREIDRRAAADVAVARRAPTTARAPRTSRRRGPTRARSSARSAICSRS